MNDDDFRRRDDILMAELSTRFKDFIERYERDWKHTQDWRKAHWEIMEEHGKLLSEMAPVYRKSMWFVGALVLGTIGVAIKAFWSHISWN